VQGHFITGNTPQGFIAEIPPQKEYYNELQHEIQMDELTIQRLRELELAKEQAVKREDYT